jgi:carbamoyltransferase
VLILGLSVATSEHHAAALIHNGQLVAAAEEERFNRIKHYGAHPAGKPLSNLINDGDLKLRDLVCRRAVAYVLSRVGATLHDVDWVAVNGIPHRFRHTYSLTDAAAPPRPIRKGKTLYIPHHLCHAASAFRLSGFEQANVLTFDGRGERETAAFFVGGADRALHRVWDVLVEGGHSFGGCYETASRRLGFGPHGQGAVMALAGLSTQPSQVAQSLWVESPADRHLSEQTLWDALAPLERAAEAPIEAAHADAAASVQLALERAASALARHAFAERPSNALCLAGGVVLNCPMNTRLVRETGVERWFVQPAAHDAGTAVGAALEAAWMLGEPAAAPMTTAAWGPEFGADTLEAALQKMGVRYWRSDEPEVEVAERLASGHVVCRFDGRLELGPRALGQRSILADPRRPELKAWLNAAKSRPAWRPFGPSMLAARRAEWLDESWDSPFMLFTFSVRPEQRSRVPVIVHADGTTRPQTVEPAVAPRYARLIEAFEAHTGVPMVVNTSFNRGGEPIVGTPEDAVASWRGLGAHLLQLGPFLCEAAPGGWRAG